MALDPIIAGGYRGVEIPNALQQYAQVTGIQNAMQEQRMRALQMQQLEEEGATRNALAQRLQSGQPFTVAEAARFGKAGYDVLTAQRQAQKALDDQNAAAADLAAKYVKQARDQLPMVNNPQTYTAWRTQTLQRLPGFESFIPPEYSPEIVGRLAIDADKMLEQHFVSQNLGGEQQVIAMPKYGGGPARVVPGSRAAEVPLPAGVEAQRGRIASAGAARTQVVMPPQEKAEQTARGGMLVKQYEGIADAARIASRTLPALEANLATLDKGFDTGFATEAKAAGARVLGALGVKDAEQYATDAQTFLANATQAVLQRQLEQKGPQTESDAQRITQTGAQLGNTKDANRFMLSVAKAQLKRDVDQRNFYDKWWKQKGTYDGAEDAWYASEGGKSLFDRPELARYKAKTPATAGEKPSAGRPPLSSIFAQPPGEIPAGRR